jgi:lipopolysaccharide export system permease protein
MTLHLYFARRFAVSFLSVFGAFAAMLALIDLIEQIRRFGGEGLSFTQVFVLTLLNLPAGLYQIMPLIMILATLSLFLALARSSELIVTRAAGRSALRAVAAPVAVAFLFGIMSVALFNPIVAATANQFELLSDRYQGRQASVLSISEEGLWLRAGGDDGQTVISAAVSNADGTRLGDVMFLRFDLNGSPQWRIEAASAQLAPGGWEVVNGKRWSLGETGNPEARAETFEIFFLESRLTLDEIRASFGSPSTVPVWALPQYIERLEKSGFTARQHRMWLHKELANPLFYTAMVLVAAAFTLRHTRFGGTGVMILIALLMAFSLYFVRNFAHILGENGQIPILLAAWGPPIATMLLPLGLLLHLEDG